MEFVQPIRDKKQINTIKEFLKATNLRDYCLFTVGINSGLRISDLLKLKVSDVIDKNGEIKERIYIREKKTNKVKDFPISEAANDSLREYIPERKNYTYEEPLFISRKQHTGKASLQRDQAYKVINSAAKSIGIKDRIGTHTLRKTFGYHAYQSGVDITLIQKLLNHSTPSITLRYCYNSR
ncbi:site-specific integrase [Paenibacillus alginolyticus]|uniref:Site-specific integrase n=1 Tax=Paenibacillus alginolyticus TaxID=59839 RepID=A0ABT4GI59_9BACL|nr:site-specific integrase [Paenibacillus alginolyticus]MCY9695900.1 site-specific integrase [Paenibacillus alginolyticus]MEC0146751.1 site-specific integrase [Paenibacillus alginolyticus]